MSTEPLRPPLEHEVCGTCDHLLLSTEFRRCCHPHKRIWSHQHGAWTERAPLITVRQGCQCWAARGEEAPT